MEELESPGVRRWAESITRGLEIARRAGAPSAEAALCAAEAICLAIEEAHDAPLPEFLADMTESEIAEEIERFEEAHEALTNEGESARQGGSIPADAYVFLSAVGKEIGRARAKFPEPDGLYVALGEEVGELSRALMEQDVGRIRAEAHQVAALAGRIALEGDPTVDGLRKARGLFGPSGGGEW